MGIDAEMFVRTKEKVTPEQVLTWAGMLGACFGPENFMIGHPRSRSCFDGARHCLTIEPHIWQDGPDIEPEDGETFIRCHLWTRYYGPGYERGNFPLIANVAEWLEQTIPGASVWYGGDSSGVLHEPFGRDERAAMWKHFCSDHGRDYHRGSWFGVPEAFKQPIRDCELCKTELTGYGSGPQFAALRCCGCGFRLSTKDAGATWVYSFREDEKEPQVFTAQQ